MGTGALATADLGGTVCESHHKTIEQKSYNLKNCKITITPKKFSQGCKSSRAHSRFPDLGFQQRD